ncbi:hypothetical protein [Vibrio crassostreae]|uniref:hypothetical protein n=1 Tax=Vibrio crassostreae TaxID=246167 RepID=UPI000F48EBA5|nr:hypothetical protein [Vibrio crassostreae]ROO74757.1 hypothetical protein EDB57_1194 [Vibrio crassostreae]
MIRDKLLDRLLLGFGEPARVTKKVNAWHITSQFGIVIEVDTPKDGSYANVWLPEPFGNVTLPEIPTTHYPEDKGRHSNTYGTPGLTRGEPALKIKVQTLEHIETFLGYLLPD